MANRTKWNLFLNCNETFFANIFNIISNLKKSLLIEWILMLYFLKLIYFICIINIV